MPSQFLTVTRNLTNGEKLLVGRVGEGPEGIYFQWDEEYLRTHPKGNLSPFRVPFQADAVRGPDRPNNGLHGFLADSLPDGWGLLLMDRCFSAHHINPLTVTPLERLAFIGERAMGALSFVPEHSAAHGLQKETLFSLQQLGMDAVQMFESETAQMLPILMETGSSAGSRPKSALWLSADGRQASSIPKEYFQPWLMKFSSSSLPLGLDEGVWEAAALTCAQRAGITTADWRLFSGLSVQGKPVQWLGMRRFDRTAQGRMYFVSAAGLLDADFRQPSLDYEHLVRLTLGLTQSHTAVMEMVRRAIFNFFLGNMDDHAKNFGFLMDDKDQWNLAPAFDITFSPTRYGEHATSFAGAGRSLTKDAVEQMRRLASLSSSEMRELGEKAAAAVETFVKEGEGLGVSKKHVPEIAALVNRNLQENSKAFGL